MKLHIPTLFSLLNSMDNQYCNNPSLDIRENLGKNFDIHKIRRVQYEKKRYIMKGKWRKLWHSMHMVSI